MSRFNDNANSPRFDGTLNRLCDLCRETFLHLQTARKDFHQTGNLAEANDFSVRDIRDMSLTEEWQEVMLAKTKDFDVLHDHHLVVRNIEQRAQQRFLRALPITFGQILHRSRHACRSVPESITLRILSKPT